MPSPLISADELLESIDDPTLVIVDCRWYLGEPDAGHDAYRQGHLPGSVYANLDDDLSGSEGGGRHPLPSHQTFDVTLARLGIRPESKVVAYDDRGGAIAARLWWMLTDQRHANTRVLDGGIQAWIEAGGELEVGETRRLEAERGSGVAVQPWRGIVSIADVEAAAGSIFDARAPERFRGDSEPIDPKAGHIPGARNLPLTMHLEGARFKDAAEIKEHLSSLDFGADTIVHCGSGVTACHLILAAAIADLPRPNLYVGSWSEWSSTDRPVAIGVGS